MKYFKLLALLLSFSCNALAQEPIKPKLDSAVRARNAALDRIFYKPIAADCDSAIAIKVFKRQKYGPALAPSGPGLKQEIRSKHKGSALAFDEEHNTAWYLLQIEFDGEMVFDITPEDSTNDYDFLLFRYDTGFCAGLQKQLPKPVRSNIRRNDVHNKGVTGLSSDAKNELQAQGPGEQFSRSLEVKKGERYMLVVDNVYPEGKAHTLHFARRKDIKLQGIATDEEGKVLRQAEVELSAPSGEVVAQTKSDDSGKYSIDARVNELTDYALTVSDSKHFFSYNTVNTRMSDSALANIRSVLPLLKKGKSFVVKGINFYGDLAVPLPGAFASMRNVAALMRKNKKLKILIEGHVNGGSAGDNMHYQVLSDKRAKAVFDYLIEKNIDADRMETVGLGDRFMLYPHPEIEAEQAANRRVEIKVKDF